MEKQVNGDGTVKELRLSFGHVDVEIASNDNSSLTVEKDYHSGDKFFSE